MINNPITMFMSLLHNTVIIVSVALLAFLGYTHSTYAAYSDPVVTKLFINGIENNTSVPNGQPVTIGWHIDGPITGCHIEDSVGALLHTIDLTVLPAIDVMPPFTPPDNSSLNFSLVCTQGASGPPPPPPPPPPNTNPPSVTIWIEDSGTPNIITSKTVDQFTGRADVNVIWDSQNSDTCSLISRESASAPGLIIDETDSAGYHYQNDTAGHIHYIGITRAITETTTFYITCTNSNISVSTTTSITLNVSNPLPPPDPMVNLWSPDTPSGVAVADPLYGYAFVDVSYTSSNATWCSRNAYRDDGSSYSPAGWGAPGLNKNYTNIRLATSTTFEVTCGRSDVTIGGILSPATSTTQTLRIAVAPPAGVPSIDAWDRSSTSPTTPTPPVTLSLTAPSPTTKNNLTYQAPASAQFVVQNADECRVQAYSINGTPLDYSDDISYHVNAWTGWSGGNQTTNRNFSLSTTTRLEVYCYRDYDVAFGDANEIADGTETVNVIVDVLDPATAAPPPVTYMYGNVVDANSQYIWANHTARVGLTEYYENGFWRWGNLDYSGVPTVNSVDFTFNHPFGASDDYDVLFHYCDESDGESDWSIKVKGTEIYAFTSNRTDSPSTDCVYSTLYTERIASGITIADGDTITVDCNNGGDGEHCRFTGFDFGAGDGASVVTSPITPTGNVDVPLLWYSENTTWCDNDIATKINGVTYPWDSDNNTFNPEWQNISTTTTFAVTCKRGEAPPEYAEDTSEVTVIVPMTSGNIVVSALLASGACINPATGLYEDWGPAFGPHPTTDICTALVDLEADSPNISGGTANNITGIYDDVFIGLRIKNIGLGDLPGIPDSDVTYVASTDFSPAAAYNNAFGMITLQTPIKTYGGVISATNGFSGNLDVEYDGIPFGNHNICVRVNLDGSPDFPESNPNPALNTSCGILPLPVPEPPMNLTASRNLIRKGETVDISWSAHTAYPMDCRVVGAGGVNYTFDASSNHSTPDPSQDNPALGAHMKNNVPVTLNNTSEFLLQCTEPITSTPFTRSIRVEVVPDYEEI